MENFKKILFCPAYPAFMLMFGLTILFQLTFLLDINWSRQITVSFYVVIFTWLLIIMMNIPRSGYEINLLDYCFVGLISMVTISLIWVNRFDGLLETPFKYIVGLMIMPFICGRLANRASIHYLVKIIIFMGSIEALILIFHLGPNLDVYERQNLFGVGHGYLLVGELLAVTVIALISIYTVTTSPRYKVLNFNVAKDIALLMLLIIPLIWSGARGYKYALVVTLFFVAVIFYSFLPRNFLSYLSKFVFICLMIFIVSHYAIDSRNISFNGYSQLTQLFETSSNTSCPEEDTNSFEIRSFMHLAAWELFIQSPIFGIGVDMFGSKSCFGPGSHPHSTIIQSFTELGILAGGLLVFMFLYSFYVLIKMLRISKVNEYEKSIVIDQINNQKIIIFLIALLCFRLFSDQFYGNYLTSAASYLTFGMVSSMLNHIK